MTTKATSKAVRKPMLMKGYEFTRYRARVTYPVLVESKHDGIRARITMDSEGDLSVESYAGKPLHNLAELLARSRPWFHSYGVLELDCEVLVNGTFEDTYRYLRSSRGVPPDLVDARVSLVLLDLPLCAMRYWDRRLLLSTYCEEAVRTHNLPFEMPYSAMAHDEEQVWVLYNHVRARGLEGAMVKTLDHLYVRKRTRDWLKLKPQENHDGVIVELSEAVSLQGNPLGRVGSVTVLLEDGSKASPAGFAHDLGADMWRNPDRYIGRWLEFVCMSRDRAGGYRHPFFKRFREDKQ